MTFKGQDAECKSKGVHTVPLNGILSDIPLLPSILNFGVPLQRTLIQLRGTVRHLLLTILRHFIICSVVTHDCYVTYVLADRAADPFLLIIHDCNQHSHQFPLRYIVHPAISCKKTHKLVGQPTFCFWF